MKLKNLSELNFTIFRTPLQLQKFLKYNLRKCNSASSFCGCVHRDKSKCLIVFPIEAEHLRVFEKTIGSFSCVNIRLTFDSQILLGKDNIDNHKLFDLKINSVNRKKDHKNFEDGRKQPIWPGHDETLTIWVYYENENTDFAGLCWNLTVS